MYDGIIFYIISLSIVLKILYVVSISIYFVSHHTLLYVKYNVTYICMKEWGWLRWILLCWEIRRRRCDVIYRYYMRGNVIYIVYCHTHIIILQPIIRRLCIYYCRLLVLTINRIILAWRSRITRWLFIYNSYNWKLINRTLLREIER